MGLATKPAQPYWHITPLSTEEKDAVSSSITQTWTDQAVKCFLINANCDNCSIPRGKYSFTCQMHKVVPVLLDHLGKPDHDRIQRVIPLLDE